ncbi:MAG: hypothetical protein LBR17_06185 [Bacteroidales bacterium]|nr:hypothetical protein [Bacteroidales bacterium]
MKSTYICLKLGLVHPKSNNNDRFLRGNCNYHGRKPSFSPQETIIILRGNAQCSLIMVEYSLVKNE